MTYLRSYFQTVITSLTKPSQYGKRGERFWKGYRYLYLLCLLASLVTVIPVAVVLFAALPKVDGFLAASRIALTEVYPPDLQITFASGAMTTNVPTPYYVDVPPSFLSYFELKEEDVIHLIAIDPKGSVEDFPEYQSFVLLTGKYFVTMDKDRSHSGGESDQNALENYRVMKYSQTKDPIVITKHTYDVVAHAVESYFVYVKPVMIVFGFCLVLIIPFAISLFWVSGFMIWFLFLSLIVLILAFFMKRKIAYSTIYVYCFYAATGAVLYACLDSLLGISIPFVPTIIVLTTLVLVLLRVPKKIS